MITFGSIEEYKRHLSLLKMFREMDKKTIKPSASPHSRLLWRVGGQAFRAVLAFVPPVF
jgi:hypothetical protein